ncbi:peptidase M48 [Thalassobacter stenotrophicus]|uniref:M48 family metalloprotease n=1 Tax=Thalassobacter TaxID=266808 RepID=UPI00051D75F1|nr:MULTISPECIES: M48 family metalloprotease [Thalassobacter]KGK79237.1 peptidase M48 [Thalassobacter stenotrophicus]KGL00552.1 peptidase M48 [Thalassobacter sp. 16PALIMAR09]
MLRTCVAGLSLLFLSACVEPTSAPPPVNAAPLPQAGAPVSAAQAMRNYNAARIRLEPVAERTCRAQTRGLNCDFLFRVDPNPNAPKNAFQSLSPEGRPLLTFAQALIADARNIDEIAFVMGHEAAHHIEEHLAEQRQAAVGGAILGSLVGAITGANSAVVDQLSRAGATVGARGFSKEHELEADALGTVITHDAGFDPLRGAAFFARIPDPGDRFLGTHPPNAARVATVRRVAAGL